MRAMLLAVVLLASACGARSQRVTRIAPSAPIVKIGERCKCPITITVSEIVIVDVQDR